MVVTKTALGRKVKTVGVAKKAAFKPPVMPRAIVGDLVEAIGATLKLGRDICMPWNLGAVVQQRCGVPELQETSRRVFDHYFAKAVKYCESKKLIETVGDRMRLRLQLTPAGRSRFADSELSVSIKKSVETLAKISLRRRLDDNRPNGKAGLALSVALTVRDSGPIPQGLLARTMKDKKKVANSLETVFGLLGGELKGAFQLAPGSPARIGDTKLIELTPFAVHATVGLSWERAEDVEPLE